MGLKINKSDIADYYNKNQTLYNLFWSDRGIHYGFWNKDTRKLSHAVENTNQFVFKLLNLQKGDYVLDAGCGVGDVSFSLVKNYGIKTTGITISLRQLKQARKKSAKLNLDNLVNFEIMDFNNTKFKNETFTKIFSVEGACYAIDKLSFLKEAYRILKPGGRIVVVDGFLTKRKLSREFEQIHNKVLLGWKIPNLSHKDDFFNNLKKVGFKNIEFYDKTYAVMPSSKRIVLYGYLFFPFSFVLSKLKVIPKNIHENSVCMINQQKAFYNFVAYGVFAAEK